MSTRSLLIATLSVTLVTQSAANVHACWLTDWLHGHSAPVYMADYPPAAAEGAYAANCAPAGSSPYAAGYTPYAAGYAPAAGRRSRAVLPLASPGRTGADYSVQRPAYYDNPSVYTGRPTLQSSGRVPVTAGSSAYAAGSSPLAQSLRGAASTSGSFYGTGNVYPDTSYASGGQASGYASAMPPSSPAAGGMTGSNVARLYSAPQPRRGGLARFFSSLLGTNYRSSYYRAPVTYYRPATTVDPVTGSNVTVQQPCTSSVQQLQRTPTRSFQLHSQSSSAAPAPSVAPAPSSSCCGDTAGEPLSGYGTASGSQPSLTAPANGVRPAGGYGTADGGRVAPIPSTGPSAAGEEFSAPNTAPLTGAPPATGRTDDRAPVEQPRLESSRPRTRSFRNGATTPSDQDQRSEVRRQSDAGGNGRRDSGKSDASESTQENSRENGGSSFRYHRQPAKDETMAARTPPSLGHKTQPARVRPIPAPNDYRSPFQRDGDATADTPRPSSEPARQQPLTAPPLPAKSQADPANTARRRPQERTRVSVPVREASLEHSRPSQRTWDERQSASASTAPRQPSAAPQRRGGTSPRVTTESSGWYSLDP